MSSKHGTLGQKIVTAAQVDLAKIDLSELSEDVRKVVRDAKIESLEGLLGPDWRRVIQELVKQYWITR